MTSRAELFEQLEPPPHGLAHLRARLDSPPTPRAPLWIAAAATCAVALALAGLGPRPAAPVTVPPGALTAAVRVPLKDDRVVFYWVASADDPHWNGSDTQP
jgi:hypothetical protein